MQISLVPLREPDHVDALQQVYRATPSYWALYDLTGSPVGQATRDLHAAAETPGRTLMGIVRHLPPAKAEINDQEEMLVDAKHESVDDGIVMVGMLDFRLDWPAELVCYLGMVMVAEPYQRQGVGTEAWALLRPWLAEAAGVRKVRLGVEQFNPGALQFFQEQGFSLTGESNRVAVGKKWVRILYMEQAVVAQDQNAKDGTLK